MHTVNPYLNFLGNTEEVFNFYRSVFGGEFSAIVRYKDTPEAGKIPPADAEKLMHIALPIGKGTVLMGTDDLESMGHKLKAGNNIHLSIMAESKEEVNKLFKGLSAGGKVMVEPTDMFWGDYFGMFTDKYGIQWMVSYKTNSGK